MYQLDNLINQLFIIHTNGVSGIIKLSYFLQQSESNWLSLYQWL